ncbi:putative YbaK/aminoacyl-tRNA synthetase-associated domain [Candidatus Terasakiella magnetica]|nr:putative YbaK/aminoacyl-tRNA synthetase-associated domain [Candidatus Terasakiella magnetica]
MKTSDDLFSLFLDLGINAKTHGHSPAHTVEEGNKVWGAIPGVHCKNLFLKDAKAKLWLVVAPADKRIDLKRLPERIGSARLSFGSAELLGQVLGIEPGSVTPFALINDAEGRVTPVLDAWMMEQPLVNYHPLRNDMTTTITSADLRAFLRYTGHTPAILTL